MATRTQRQAGGTATTGAPRPPVVVTFDRDGELLDVVGDFDWFVAGGDAREDVYQRLRDLRGGGAGVPDLVQAVELSEGRYADVQVVEEGDSCHFVLRDATALMQVLQRKQQAGNEAELREARLRKALLAGATPQRTRALQPFRRGAELFATLADEMRAPLALLAGHAHLLGQQHRDDPAAMRSVAAIQHATVRLEAMSNNALLALGELDAGGEPGVLELAQLAALLQQSFGLQACAQGVAFEVRLPKRGATIEVDDLALRQLLINLVIHALDGAESGTLAVSLAAAAGALEIELSHEPGGFDAQRFGALATSSDLLRQADADAGLALAASQLLLRRMKARAELVPRQAGGHELWIRVPVPRVLGERVVGKGKLAHSPVREAPAAASRPGAEERIAVVAAESARSAETLVENLTALGVPALAVDEPARIEALLRDDAVSLLVLSAGFGGGAGRELARRLGHGTGVAMLLLDAAEQPDETGWRRDGRHVVASPRADRDTLHAVLAELLAPPHRAGGE